MRIAAITTILAVASISAIAATTPGTAKHAAPASTIGYSFEDASLPAEWQSAGLDMTLSRRHFKNGSQSLRWRWKAGEKWTVLRPDGLATAARAKAGGIYVWIYNETPTTGSLTFRFANQHAIEAGQPAKYRFQFNLNYEGWRAAWVAFAEDATDRAFNADDKSPVDSMQIIAPQSGDRRDGTIFIDQLEFQPVAGWLRTPDYQMPFVNPTRGGKDVSEDVKDNHVDINALTWSRIQPPAAPATITDAQRAGFTTITQRYDQWLYGENAESDAEPYFRMRYDARAKYIQAGLEAFAKLNIRRVDGAITGTPLFALLDAKHKPSFTDVFEDVIMPLALDWKLNHNAKSRDRFFDLVDYLHDQGWAEGSSNGTLDHQPLRVSGYMHAIYMMRDDLKATGRLSRELATMRWYTYFNNSYRADQPPGNSADQIRNAMLHRVLLVLAADDSPEKVRDMQALVNWENAAVAIAPGWVDCIKPDFTGFHHRGIYANVYSPDAFHMGALCFWLQHGTPFAMSNQSSDNLRNALLTARILTNKYEAPVAVSGRMPFGPGTADRILPGFAYLALSGDTPDHQMAAAFKRLWNPDLPSTQDAVITNVKAGIFFSGGLGGLQVMQQVADLPIAAEAAPSGNWIKPYGGLMVHRRDEWMLCVKGWSKYVWSFERAVNENVFGRNLSFGSIQLLCSGDPVTRDASGTVEAGWDWNRIPGTTAIHTPLEQLNDKSNAMRFFSDQTFVGGVTLNGRDGLFAMRLHDVAYEPTFFANKSVFCFDNRVVCLGSGIVNDNAALPTQTTLFQTHLTTPDAPTSINSTTPTGQSPAQTFDNGQRVWLTDSVGNGYLIPHAAGLHAERGHQTSIDSSGKNATEGDFVTAWIDHGAAPRDGGYEYGMLVQGGSAEKIAAFAADPGYEVLRRDAAAHAVRDTRSGEIGCAIFDAAEPVQIDLLQRVSLPCMVMFQKEKDVLHVAVANPDLGLIPADQPQPASIEEGITDRHLLRVASPVSTIRLTLSGTWKAPQSKDIRVISSDGASTTLGVDCQNGLTTEFVLRRQ